MSVLDILISSRKLKWTEEDLKNLNCIYTSKMVHIAIELADKNKDWVSFDYILNKNVELLQQHLDNCEIKKWNYRSRQKFLD